MWRFVLFMRLLSASIGESILTFYTVYAIILSFFLADTRWLRYPLERRTKNVLLTPAAHDHYRYRHHRDDHVRRSTADGVLHRTDLHQPSQGQGLHQAGDAQVALPELRTQRRRSGKHTGRPGAPVARECRPPVYTHPRRGVGWLHRGWIDGEHADDSPQHPRRIRTPPGDRPGYQAVAALRGHYLVHPGRYG